MKKINEKKIIKKSTKKTFQTAIISYNNTVWILLSIAEYNKAFNMYVNFKMLLKYIAQSHCYAYTYIFLVLLNVHCKARIVHISAGMSNFCPLIWDMFYIYNVVNSISHNIPQH